MCPGYLAFKMIWVALIFLRRTLNVSSWKKLNSQQKRAKPHLHFSFLLVHIHTWCLRLLCTKYPCECTIGCHCALHIWCQPRHDTLSNEQYVQEMVFEIICQLLHPSLLLFISQMLRQILNPGTVNPASGADSFNSKTERHNMMSLTKCPEREETEDKPRRGTCKRFLVSTFRRTFLLCCDSSERKSEAVSGHDLTGLTNRLLTTEHRYRFVRHNVAV